MKLIKQYLLAILLFGLVSCGSDEIADNFVITRPELNDFALHFNKNDQKHITSFTTKMKCKDQQSRLYQTQKHWVQRDKIQILQLIEDRALLSNQNLVCDLELIAFNKHGSSHSFSYRDTALDLNKIAARTNLIFEDTLQGQPEVEIIKDFAAYRAYSTNINHNRVELVCENFMASLKTNFSKISLSQFNFKRLDKVYDHSQYPFASKPIQTCVVLFKNNSLTTGLTQNFQLQFDFLPLYAEPIAYSVKYFNKTHKMKHKVDRFRFINPFDFAVMLARSNDLGTVNAKLDDYDKSANISDFSLQSQTSANFTSFAQKNWVTLPPGEEVIFEVYALGSAQCSGIRTRAIDLLTSGEFSLPIYQQTNEAYLPVRNIVLETKRKYRLYHHKTQRRGFSKTLRQVNCGS